ncbi:MAG: hypothetical protein DHS20C11_33720 [Lysobacteraceae bacterium]|nr:MAG: hypothetical protein DHS20C11_33720 [Xanthomonadaceae bacterium]
MLTQLAEVRCPYCGEAIEMVVDPSVSQQTYVEDCEVCCQPIEVTVVLDEVTGEAQIIPSRDDE